LWQPFNFLSLIGLKCIGLQIRYMANYISIIIT
jgi:hypothetical protein